MNHLPQLEEPRAMTDYLLTSFQEYKITTAKTMETLQSKVTTLTKQVEELKEEIKGSFWI